MAQRTPDRLRQDAAKLGPVIGAYVDRLLGAREHPEQGFRACLGVFRLVTTYGAARVVLACERALAAGVLSSRYLEQLLNADRRQPFLDQQSDEGLGVHSNVRGPSYYN
jgi:transposase